jgi:hypothetical protein
MPCVATLSKMSRGVAASLLICLGCTASPRAESDGRDSAAPAVTPAPQDTTPREVYIDSVMAGNPLVVYGRARTFENNVQVRVRSSTGDSLAQTFTTSVGEMGHHNPFTVDVWLVRDPGQRLTVEAFEYSAMDGSVRSLTSRELAYDRERVPLTLLFTTGDDCTTTRAFTRSVPKSAAVARLSVEALAAGPDPSEIEGGANRVFPRYTRVNSVNLREGTLTVDFNERLQNVGGACAATAIRESVTRTLRQLPAVQRVVITAGGSEKLALQP